MTSIFWFALVVGGGLLLLSVLGDLFGDAEVEFGDTGAELDLGDVASGTLAGGSLDPGDLASRDVAIDTAGSYWHAIFSLRSLTYFLFGFGATGVLLDFAWQGAHSLITLVASLGAGVMAGGFNAILIGYIRRTDSGRMAGDGALIGLEGRVILPLRADGTGKIEVRRAGREHELLARPFEAKPTAPEEWTRVIVVEMRDGIALVVPLDGAEITLLGPAAGAEEA